MAFTISAAEYFPLWKKNCQPDKYNLVLDDDEILFDLPASLGQHGYSCYIELLPGISLAIWNLRCDRDFVLKYPGGDRLSIEMIILNSGYFPSNDIYPIIGGKQSYFGGSGVLPANLLQFLGGQHLTAAIVNLEPEVFASFFPNLDLNSAFGKQIIKQDDWIESFFPKVTPSISASVWQMINTPYRSAIRKIYLQGKVLELLAMQLSQLSESKPNSARSTLQRRSIDRIYQARDILATRLENPPSILELTQKVGISDRTLRRGFREIFGTTIIGYLTSLRMKQAEQLLRQRKLSIGEVANAVGYSHLGHFSAAFKDRFGITPSECKRGKKTF